MDIGGEVRAAVGNIVTATRTVLGILHQLLDYGKVCQTVQRRECWKRSPLWRDDCAARDSRLLHALQPLVPMPHLTMIRRTRLRQAVEGAELEVAEPFDLRTLVMETLTLAALQARLNQQSGCAM